MAMTPGPGERQHGESAKAFAAFRTYVDLGPRRSTALVGWSTGTAHRARPKSGRLGGVGSSA